MKDTTLMHTERTDGTIITVSAHADGRFTIHTRKRWELGVLHVGFQEITRQQVLSMGLSKELQKAEQE